MASGAALGLTVLRFSRADIPGAPAWPFPGSCVAQLLRLPETPEPLVSVLHMFSWECYLNLS